jgi:hypothetical protein
MKKTSVLFLLIFLASPVHAMVYTWTDAGGVTHFTNKEYEIPARYRARTKARYPEQSDSSAPQQTLQTTQAGAAAQPQSSPAMQAKPLEPKTMQPAIAPPPRKTPTDKESRRAKRSRERGSEEE